MYIDLRDYNNQVWYCIEDKEEEEWDEGQEWEEDKVRSRGVSRSIRLQKKT